ncbi:hypothetical protein MTO96_021255 [Rhipicephalus appendiculatus]
MCTVSASLHHRPVEKRISVVKDAAVRHMSQKRSKRCDQPRESTLGPVQSHRRPLCTPLNGRRWLPSTVPDPRSPFVQGERAGFEAQRLGRKWSSISVWTTWHLRRLQRLLLLVHQAAADTRPRDSECPG